MPPLFDHEKLKVYQKALEAVSSIQPLLNDVPKGWAVWDQLDRAVTSIPLNIAEGNGKFTSPDRCHFFDIARGSALESAACLDVLVAKQKFKPEEVAKTKEMLKEIVSMLVGLIKSNSSSRMYEAVKDEE